jgi:thioredoxin-like negative regulator of GroEL
MKILNITPDNAHLFKDIINKEHVIIKFYSPTCSACLAMTDEWNKLENEMKNKMNHIHLLNVRNDSLPHLQHDIVHSVEYFPKIIVNKLDDTGNYKEFQGIRNVETMSKWIKSIFGSKKKREKRKKGNTKKRKKGKSRGKKKGKSRGKKKSKKSKKGRK